MEFWVSSLFCVKTCGQSRTPFSPSRADTEQLQVSKAHSHPCPSMDQPSSTALGWHLIHRAAPGHSPSPTGAPTAPPRLALVPFHLGWSFRPQAGLAEPSEELRFPESPCSAPHPRKLLLRKRFKHAEKLSVTDTSIYPLSSFNSCHRSPRIWLLCLCLCIC